MPVPRARAFRLPHALGGRVIVGERSLTPSLKCAPITMRGMSAGTGEGCPDKVSGRLISLNRSEGCALESSNLCISSPWCTRAPDACSLLCAARLAKSLLSSYLISLTHERSARCWSILYGDVLLQPDWPHPLLSYVRIHMPTPA